MSSFGRGLCVIVPCYDEEAVLAHAHARLVEVLERTGVDFEILYVDDGSKDRTPLLLKGLADTCARVRVVRLSRNFGHQIAVTAGLDHADAAAVVVIDADLQDPPEVIAQMLAKWREGAQVVYGVRKTRDGESAFKLWTARVFYRLINRLSEVPLPPEAGDFRLMDRKVVLALRGMRERHRLLRAMTTWVGFRQVALPYDRAARFAGVSKYPLRKMLALAIDGIVSFSTTPLRIVTFVGLGFSALSVLGILYAFVLRLLTNNWVPGWTLIFISLMLIGGLQFMFLGIVGEYVGRIYGETKQRPLFLVLETFGGASTSEVSRVEPQAQTSPEEAT